MRILVLKFTVLFIITLTGTLPLSSARGDEISFTASVDRRSITPDDSLIYTLTIEGGGEAVPELPRLEGFHLLETSVGTSIEIINNQLRQTRNFRYTFRPRSLLQPGDYRIPPAILRHGGRTYASNPVTVRVVERGTAPAPEAEPPPLFMEASLDREEAFVNEQVTLAVRIFFRRPGLANLNYSPPPATGMIAESLGPERRYQRVIDGARYEVIEIRTAIFPIGPGELTIGPAELRGTVPTERREPRRSPFDDFFSDDFFGFRRDREPFHIESRPVSLRVKPWPREERPAEFDGAVGSFDLSVGANPLTLDAGEAVTLTIRVEGEGNLAFVRPPRVDIGSEFRVYPPEEEVRPDIREDRIGGEKIFRQVLIPQQAGELEIPEVRFGFLDPESGDYRLLRSRPVRITARPVETEPVRLVEAPDPGIVRPGIPVQEADILYIKEGPERWRRRRDRPPAGRFWPYLLPWPVILVLRKLQDRRERIRSDLTYARRRAATRVVRERFRKARKLARAGDREGFHGELHRALLRYLSDKSGVPVGAVGPETLGERLAGAGEGLKEELEEVLRAAEHARYAPGGSGAGDMRTLLEKVERLIGRMEKVKW